MAILVNKGLRGFVLKEGLLAPGQQITVDQETAEKLSRTYPKELMLIMPEVKKAEPMEQPKPVPAVNYVEQEPEAVPAVEAKPKKRSRKAKAK